MGALGYGCGDSSTVVGPARDGGPPQDASQDSPLAAPPDAGTCAVGNSRLRVNVQLDPALDRRRMDVWLVARCGSDPPSRIVRWDRSPSQTLDGLGAGTWRVYASAFVAPGAWSDAVTLEGVSTVTVPVALRADARLLTAWRSDETPDAGSRARVPIRDPSEAVTLGWLELTYTPAMEGFVRVEALVRNACTAEPCPPLALHSVEARSVDGETPVDLAVVRLQDAFVGVGGSYTVPSPMVLRAPGPMPGRGLQVALYGDLPPPPRP